MNFFFLSSHSSVSSPLILQTRRENPSANRINPAACIFHPEFRPRAPFTFRAKNHRGAPEKNATKRIIIVYADRNRVSLFPYPSLSLFLSLIHTLFLRVEFRDSKSLGFIFIFFFFSAPAAAGIIYHRRRELLYYELANKRPRGNKEVFAV